MHEQLYHILSASIEFCHEFEEKYDTFLKEAGFKQRTRKSKMELAEALTIQVYFHFSGYRNFKKYYCNYVQQHLDDCFFLVSYSQFNKVINETPFLIDLFLGTRSDKGGKFNFIDATCLSVCHKKRARSQKVFGDSASFGFSTIHGQFFGFKLHLVVNHRGKIAAYAISTAKHHDSKYTVQLSNGLSGRLCGDKAYISKRHQEKLAKQEVKLITHSRKDMLAKNIFHGVEKRMLRHRGLVESVFNKLKNVINIVTHRSRSVSGFMTHCLSALLAYTFDSKTPSITMP